MPNTFWWLLNFERYVHVYLSFRCIFLICSCHLSNHPSILWTILYPSPDDGYYNRNVNVDFTSWYIHLFGLYFFLLPSYIYIYIYNLLSTYRLDFRSWEKPGWLKRQSKIQPLRHEETSASEGNLNAYVSHLFCFTYIRLTATETSIHLKSLALR